MSNLVNSLQNLSFPSTGFQLTASFRERIDELKLLKEEMLHQYPHKPSTVILGAGPAGLIRAIGALVNGNPTTVIEKRFAADPGRENTVILKKQTLHILHYFGIYQYLLERRIIFPCYRESLQVRIKDLEEAMKAVITELGGENVINYGSQVEQIISHRDAKADLLVRSQGGRQVQINAIDLLVVAEGAHGNTNENLLHNRRILYLSPIPVITAVFKDNRPTISSIPTLFKYIGKTLLNTVTGVYYYSLFAFKTVFGGEHILNKRRNIIGAAILKTPGQNYMGYGLSKEQSDKMIEICNRLKEAKTAFEEARNQNCLPETLARLQQQVHVAQKQRDDYFHYWTGLAFCFANLFNIMRFVLTWGKTPLQLASWLPLDRVMPIEIGADRSNVCSGTINRTAYLIAGDTLATVDPTTGRGCTTAINTFIDFHRFLIGMDRNENQQTLLDNYNRSSSQTVSHMHDLALNIRMSHRPDAVEVRPTGLS